MTAVLIPFPSTRQTGKIRHVAAILRRKHGRDADRYWRQVVLVMRAQLQRAQIDPETVEQELRAFSREVFARLPFPETSTNPRGAA